MYHSYHSLTIVYVPLISAAAYHKGIQGLWLIPSGDFTNLWPLELSLGGHDPLVENKETYNMVLLCEQEENEQFGAHLTHSWKDHQSLG